MKKKLLGLLEDLYAIPHAKIRSVILRLIRKIEGGYFYEETSRSVYKKYHDIAIGYGSCGCIDLHCIPKGTTFGNYCGISENTRIFNANHPPKYFTTHALLFNPRFGCTNEDVLPRTKLYIGHDVWTGYSSIILPSVKSIGNGAIIGAGAVLTKDVDNYAIMVGNPAKCIRYRFNAEVIEKLEQSKWWLLSKEELIQNKQKLENITNFSIDDLIKQRNKALGEIN